MNRNADFIGPLPLVFEKEINYRRADRHREEHANRDHEQHQVVHLGSEVGSLLRIQWHLRLHDQWAPCWLKFACAARLSRLRKITIINSRPATGPTATKRITPKIVALYRAVEGSYGKQNSSIVATGVPIFPCDASTKPSRRSRPGNSTP